MLFTYPPQGPIDRVCAGPKPHDGHDQSVPAEWLLKKVKQKGRNVYCLRPALVNSLTIIQRNAIL